MVTPCSPRPEIDEAEGDREEEDREKRDRVEDVCAEIEDEPGDVIE
jgi:hypothetical protein